MRILERLPGEKAAVYAERVLRQNILDLELEPGSPVSENELAAELGLSRTPVREALIELGRCDLISILPQRGTYISPIDLRQVGEARFLRRTVEIEVVRLVSERGMPEALLQQLKDNLAGQKQASEPGHELELHALDMNFHRIIFEVADKIWSFNVIRTLMVHFDRLRILTLRSLLRDRTIRDHENLVYAIEHRDSELACYVMEKHLTRDQLDQDLILQDHPHYLKNVQKRY